MKIIKELESVFFSELDFTEGQYYRDSISKYCHIARSYAQVENAFVVLSDLLNCKSYICIGASGAQFGLIENENKIIEVDSIDEDMICTIIHPSDLLKKHLLGLKFARFIEGVESHERFNYCTNSKIRMINIDGEYQYVNHRTQFLDALPNGDMFLMLSIYRASTNQAQAEGINAEIVDSVKGVIIEYNPLNSCKSPLTPRETEVLFHILRGCSSKEIAIILNITFNTVNCHRQNIIKKLAVKNSSQAIKRAKELELL